MSNGFKTVLIAGASGWVGEKVTPAFLKNSNWKVSILVSPETLKDAKKRPLFDNYVAQGATLVEGDITKPETYQEKIKGIDVVVATLGGAVIHTQIPLVHAAKAAGVKLFVPSEYGLDVEHSESPIFAGKKSVRKEIESLGLNHTYIVTGPFYEFYFGWPGWHQDLVNHKATLVGERSTKVSLAPFTEVAELFPAIVNDPSSINKIVALSGDQITIGAIYDELVAALGDKVSTHTLTIAELKERLASNPNLPEELLLLIATGGAYDARAVDGSKYGKKLSTIKEFLPGFIKKVIANKGAF